MDVAVVLAEPVENDVEEVVDAEPVTYHTIQNFKFRMINTFIGYFMRKPFAMS